MSLRERHRESRPGRQAGSALILVLFACLATAVVLQSLCTVLVFAERAVVDESVGRERLAEKDEALAILRQQALDAVAAERVDGHRRRRGAQAGAQARPWERARSRSFPTAEAGS